MATLRVLSKYKAYVNPSSMILIFDTRSLLGPYFNEIYLMPDNPELERVNRALKERYSNAPRR